MNQRTVEIEIVTTKQEVITIGRCIMGMLLSEQSEYLREYGNVANSTWNWRAGKLKKIVERMTTFSPILWILFFLMLTVLTNALGK